MRSERGRNFMIANLYFTIVLQKGKSVIGGVKLVLTNTNIEQKKTEFS